MDKDYLQDLFIEEVKGALNSGGSGEMFYIKTADIGDATGAVDVTAKLQTAIDNAHKKGYKHVEFEKGTYLISTQKVVGTGNSTMCGGLELYSNTEYNFGGSVLKLVPTSSIAYNMLFLEYLENVTVRNVELWGDRKDHDYSTYSSTHEFGYGIGQHSCKNVLYENIIVHDCTGDGIYWGFGYGGIEKWTPEYYNYDCAIRNGEFYNIRRNGLSPCTIVGLTLENVHIHDIGTTIDGISGVAPKMGIDMEPYTQYEWVENVFIRNTIIENTAGYPIGIPKAVNVHIEDCKLITTDTDERGAIYTSDRTVTTVYVKNTKFVGFKYMNGYVDRYENCDLGGAPFFDINTGNDGELSGREFVATGCVNASSKVTNAEATKLKSAIISNCTFMNGLPTSMYVGSLTINNCIVNVKYNYITSHADKILVSGCVFHYTKNIPGAFILYNDGNAIEYNNCKFYLKYDDTLASAYSHAVHWPSCFESCSFICEGVGVIGALSARNCHFNVLPSNNTNISAVADIGGNEAYNCMFDSSANADVRFSIRFKNQYKCVSRVNFTDKYTELSFLANTKMIQNIFENVGAVEAVRVPNYNSGNYTVTDHGSVWINCAMGSY